LHSLSLLEEQGDSRCFSKGHLGERQEHLQPGILRLKRLQLARLGDVHLPNFAFHLQHVAALIPCLRHPPSRVPAPPGPR
jgi:hypothetical protein